MLTPPVHPLQLAGVVFTMALLALAWASRGRLNSMGFEFLHWNRTSGRENAEALGFGAVCGLAVALLFQALYKGTPFKWQDAWIGITLGPLMEETVFRGYLFGLAEWGLRKRVPQAAWTVGIAIAAVFAHIGFSVWGVYSVYGVYGLWGFRDGEGGEMLDTRRACFMPGVLPTTERANFHGA